MYQEEFDHEVIDIPSKQSILDLMKVKNDWLKQPNETDKDYQTRYQIFWNRYKVGIREYGVPVLKPNIDGTTTILWSKDINIGSVKDEVISNKRFIMVPIKDGNGSVIGEYPKWFCPFHKREEEYLMRILRPCTKQGTIFNNGFLDGGGVLTDCLCLALRIKDKANIIYKSKHKNRKEDEDEADLGF